MNSTRRLAEKILSQFQTKGYIERNEIDKFTSKDWEKEDRKEIIKHLMELAEDPGVKLRLHHLYEQNHFRRDTKLEILMI